MSESMARKETHDSAALVQEAFASFPYALLVLAPGGRVLCANAQAKRLLRGADLSEREASCCSLLGCRRPGTALSAACLTERALEERATALPEVPVLLAADDGPTTMWVTAASVCDAERRVALVIRADRERAVAAAAGAAPTRPLLRIRTLGGTVVESARGSLDGPWLEQRAGQLLKYLIAERRRAATVEEIGESIWPGAEYAVAGSVRYYVHVLRRTLEPDRGSRAPSAVILSRAGSYALNRDRVQVDADEFEATVAAGLAALERAGPAASAARADAVAAIERGLSLYRGDFLADIPYAEWALPERHRLHELACRGLFALAEVHLAADSLDAAARALQRAASMQPYDEDVHKRMIELDIARGRRSDAMRRYAILRARLRRSFGHEPSFTPAELVPGSHRRVDAIEN